MHLTVIGVIIGEPFSVYSFLIIAGLVAASFAYWYIIGRFSSKKSGPMGAVLLVAVLAFEMIFLALVLGIFGLFLFIAIEFWTAHFIKRHRKGIDKVDT